MRRRSLVALSIVALAAAVAALRGCDDEFPDPPPDERELAEAAPESEDAPRRRERVGDLSDDGSTAASPPVAKPREVDGFPAVEVRVEHADGTPALGGIVYAMRAGAPGRQRAETGIHAMTGVEGTCVLAFPAEGAFDVGVRLDELHTFHRDVSVPRDKPIVFTLPAPASLVFEFDTTDAPETDSQRPRDRVHIVTEVAGTDLERRFPGREDTLGWRGDVRPDPEDPQVELRAPRGVSLFAIADGRLVVTPRSLKPPATASVTWWRSYQLELTVTFAPPPDTEIDDGWIDLTFEERHSNLAGRRGVTTRWSDLVPADDGTRSIPLPLEFHLSGGKLVWSGPGIRPGAASVEGLTLDGDNEQAIRVELTGEPLPASDPRVRSAPPTRVRPSVSDGDRGPVKAFVAHTYGGGMGSEIAPGATYTTCVLDPGWVVAHRDHDVAGPVPVKPGGDVVHELTLTRGGFVVLAVDDLPPRGLGRYTLEPADRGVVLVDGVLLASVDVHDGLRLGPLEARGHTFRLRLGEEALGELTIAVTPGSEQEIAVPDPTPAR